MKEQFLGIISRYKITSLKMKWSEYKISWDNFSKEVLEVEVN